MRSPEPFVRRPGKFLFATWDGGGNVPPALALARRLVARRHHVRVLGPRGLRRRIEASGCVFRPYVTTPEFDPSAGRAIEDQMGWLVPIWAGWQIAADLLEELDREPADVLIIDCLLDNALSAAEATRLPTAALVHVLYNSWIDTVDTLGWEDEFSLMNETRTRLGLPLISPEWPIAELWSKPARVLALVAREFDVPTDKFAPNARYVGPIFDEREETHPWDLPWALDDRDPLILISLSTTYQHQEDALRRILEAVASTPGRKLLTLGGGLGLGEVDVPEGVIVRQWLPHGLVLPHASAVITHAGLGTVSAALAHGVPMVCMPLGREQPSNAKRVAGCEAGVVIPQQASPGEIREALMDVLGSERYRAGARRMAEVIAGYGQGELAVAELEGLVIRP